MRKLLLTTLLIFLGSANAQILRIPSGNEVPAPVSGEIGFEFSTGQVAENAVAFAARIQRVDPVGTCSVFVNLSDITAVAGTDYVDGSPYDVPYADGVGGLQQLILPVIDRPGEAQGNLTYLATMTKNSCASDTLVNDTMVITIIDQDADNSFPTGWAQPTTQIDGTVRTFTCTAAYETATGRFTVNNDGGEIFTTTDHFCAPTYAIASLGDVTFSACVVQSHTGSLASFPKAGVMLRETNNPTSTNVFANILGVDGLQGYNLSRRASTSATTTKVDYASPAVTLSWGVQLEVDGALESWKAYYSESCATPSWVQYDAGTEAWLGTSDSISAALASTVNDSADVGWTGDAIFTELSGVSFIDTSSVDHSAGSTVDVQPVAINVNEDAGTVAFTMNRAGGLSGALAVDWTDADGTCTDGVHYTSGSGQLNWADGVGGTDSDTISIIDIPGAQGSASCTFTVTATINSGADTLGADTLTVTWLDTDQTPPQTGSWSAQGASGCSDATGSFDAYIPGMRGTGSCTRGGFVPGTTVIRVNTLNATGAGSLDAAGAAACPKVILFDVGGLIDANGNTITMNRCSNWSIVGASAPGLVTVARSTNATFEVRGSDWTIDHLTIAAGDAELLAGNTGNRRSIQYSFGQGTPDSRGILLNNDLIWGSDETVTCYTIDTSEQSDMLMWQNVVALPTGQHLLHIIQNTCWNYNTIRNSYIHSNGRMPLVRADGYFHANNFTANAGFQTAQVSTCSGATAGQLATVRQNYINNFAVKGPQSTNEQLLRGKENTCLTLEVHESGNAQMQTNNSIDNCANNGCTSGFVGGELKASIISAIYPTGYVPEVITQTSQGLIDFATQITAFSGSRPQARLPYIQTNVDESINMVDGVGPVGGHSDSSTTEGGIAVITPATSPTWNPTDAADNPCAENMPTGAAANAITTSGLTRLHEWVIGCFYDDVMPSGYREDGLQYYATP